MRKDNEQHRIMNQCVLAEMESLKSISINLLYNNGHVDPYLNNERLSSDITKQKRNGTYTSMIYSAIILMSAYHSPRSQICYGRHNNDINSLFSLSRVYYINKQTIYCERDSQRTKHRHKPFPKIETTFPLISIRSRQFVVYWNNCEDCPSVALPSAKNDDCCMNVSETKLQSSLASTQQSNRQINHVVAQISVSKRDLPPIQD